MVRPAQLSCSRATIRFTAYEKAFCKCFFSAVSGREVCGFTRQMASYCVGQRTLYAGKDEELMENFVNLKIKKSFK